MKPLIQDVLQLVATNKMAESRAVALLQELRAGTAAELGLYTPVWEPVAPARSAPAPLASLLVLDDDDARCAALRAALPASARLVRVRTGTAYERLLPELFRLNPRQGEDFQRLLAELSRDGLEVRHVLQAWGWDSPLPSESLSGQALEQATEEALARGVLADFELCKALMQARVGGVELLHAYSLREEAPSPFAEMVAGFARSLALENPAYRVRVVGFEAGAERPDALARALLGELADGGAVEARWTPRGRRALRVEPLQVAGATGGLSLRMGGTYLISGGLGGLGLVFAEHLAEVYRARLVLLGRRQVEAGIDRALRGLEGRGAEVLYVPCDVTDSAQVDEALATARRRFGALHGVFHSVGVLHDAFVLKKSRVQFEAVLAPKVLGTLLLDRACRDDALDCFVVFSSAAALLGNVGQCDYASGNAFLDAFSGWRQRMAAQGGRRGASLSLDWPLWRDGGMTVDEETRRRLRESWGVEPLGAGLGLAAFELAGRSGAPRVMVAYGDQARFRAALERLQADRPASAGAPAAGAPEDEAALRERIEAHLRELVARRIKLPVERLRSDRPFQDYGIDSVMVLSLTESLEETFGALPKTLFFEYGSVAELAQYFLSHHGARLRERFLPPAPAQAVAPGAAAAVTHPVASAATAGPRFAPDGPRPAVGEEGIAVIGLAGRFPMAGDVAELWENLVAGRDCITEIPRERWDHARYFDPDKSKAGRSYGKWGGFLRDFDCFDPMFFNISPREAEFMDPQERLFLEIAWEVLEDAGYTRQGLAAGGGEVGVFVGVMYGHYQLHGAEESARGRLLATDSSHASIANRVSYVFDFHGPSLAVDTMCSSSLAALHLACESIRRGECQAALAGGVNVMSHPNKYLLLSQGKFLSTDGRCRSFGEGGDGYVPGEGVGAVMLKPLAGALRDGDHVYCVIKGSAMNHGGKANHYTVPSPNAQARAIAQALGKAGVSPRSISYLEAHGTGTALGDPVEIRGLAKAFGEGTDARQFCAIGSIKSNIGHLESAAGIAGLAKIILQLQHGKLVPSLHAGALNPHIDFAGSPFFVQRELSEWKRPLVEEGGQARGLPRRAGLSSFGAGGSNVHVVVEEAPLPAAGARALPEGLGWVVPLSARTDAALVRRMDALRRRLASPGPEWALADLSYTLAAGREHFAKRCAFVVHSVEELRQALDEVRAGRSPAGYLPGAAEAGLAEGPALKALISALLKEARELLDRAEPAREEKLWAMADLFRQGREVDWAALYEGSGFRRVSLPTYPFARERYWVPAAPAEAERAPAGPVAARGGEPAEEAAPHLFEPIWVPAPLEVRAAPAAGPLLVLESGPGVAEQLRRAGHDVVRVRPGPELRRVGAREYVLPPASAADYARLLGALEEEGCAPAGVVHLWSHLPFGAETGAALEARLEESVYSMFHLARALVERRRGERLSLLYGYVRASGTPQPLYASLSGFARSLMLEQPRIACRVLELAAASDEELGRQVLAELGGGAGAPVDVRYQGGTRWARRVSAVEPGAGAQAPALREGGVYVISGGAGGLGLLFAEHLARAARAKLVLLGRSALAAGKAERLRALERLGAEVLYLPCDVANASDVERAIAEAKRRFGAIHGVLHAAGVLRDGLLAGKDAGSFRAVLAPKVAGTLNLDAATRDEPLEAFVLFSSLAGTTGNPGQTDYATGNAFLDAFGEYREELRRAGARRGRTLSIAWPLWREGGMGVGGPDDARAADGMLRAHGLTALSTAHGLAAFEAALRGSRARLVVVGGDRERISALLERSGAVPAAPEAPAVKAAPAAAPRSLEGAVRAELSRAVSELLKVEGERVDPQASFGDFGFDSVTLKELADRLNATYGLELMPNIFFGHNSIARLGDHLLVAYGEALARRHAAPAEAPTPAPAPAPRAAPVPERRPESVEGEARAGGAEPIAIIGAGGIFPESADLDAFWDNLAAEGDLIREVPLDRWDWRKHERDGGQAWWGGFIPDVDRFDAAFFRISPREAQLMDPQHRVFLETAWRTIENAGYAPSGLAGQSVGVFVGVQFNEYQGLVKDSGDSHGFAATGNSHAMLANRLSYLLDIHGPSESVDTACSSSLVALARALTALQVGDCETALVGGVNLMLSPDTFVVTRQMGVLSPDGRCKTFDRTANGYVKGEGVGVVFLKPLSRALRDGDPIQAVIRSAVVNHGGAAHSLTAPNPRAQSALLARAYRKAGVDPATVTYIEAHGTGTELGDPVEVDGLKQAFREQGVGPAGPGGAPHCGLGSVKSNIGHLEPAAGIAGLLKVVLAMRHGKLPASLHCKELNPYIQLDGSPFYIVRHTQDWPRARDAAGLELPRRAGVSSFGFGGTNAHVVLEEAPSAPVPVAAGKPCYLVTLSAKAEEALKQQVEQLAAWLARRPGEARLEDVSYTLNAARDHHAWRCCFVASSLEELRTALEQVREGRAPEGYVAGGARPEKDAHSPLFDEVLAMLQDALRAPGRLDAAAYRRKLLALADLYTRGYAVDWSLLHEGEAKRRVALPGYAFLRKRHWVSAAGADGTPVGAIAPRSAAAPLAAPAASPTPGVEAPGTDFFFVPTWAPVPLARAPREAGGAPVGRSILIAGGAGHPMLVAALKAGHARDRILELDSADAVAVDSRVVQATRIDCVYFLGGMPEGPFDPADLPALAQSQERGALALFRLVKALHRYRYGGVALALKVLVSDVHPLTAEAPVHPGGAALVGFVQSLAKEFPAWSVSCLDVDGEALHGENGREAAIRALVEEPGHPEGEPVLLRGRVRYARTVRPLALPPAGATRFKRGGVYFILGGAGGIGLALGEYLARTVQARLVLVGRRPLSPEQSQALARMEASGGQALYLQADATELASMRAAVARAKAAFGHLDGAIHSAIVLRDKLLANMDEETFRAALAPKVQGSVVLQQALEGEPLDFLLFLSSAQSFLGDAGQSNYAAGSTFKDAFAHFVGRTRRLPVRIINWGYWGRVGIVATDDYNRRLSALGVLSIEVPEGMDAIERVLAGPAAQVVALKVRPEVLEKLGIDVRQPLLALPEEVPSIGERVVQAASAQLPPPREVEQKAAAFAQLERFGQRLVLSALQEMGALRRPGERSTPEALRARLGIVTDFHRLFESLLGIVERAGFVSWAGGEVEGAPALASPELQRALAELERTRAELALAYPEMAAHLELLWTCVRAYPGVLRGQVDPIGVMFPNGSMAKVEAVYKGNELVDRCNEAVTRAVVGFVEERLRAPGGRVRIVEVGAGTGGTSDRLLRALAPYGERLEYVYTDISPSFLKFGADKYGRSYPFSRFQALNIEKGPGAQGFEVGSFDLVVATNVLHATRAMGATLRNVKRLLRRHGALVLNEVMVPQDFATLTFGLTKGWWLYDDEALRLPGGPLLGLLTWRALLQGEGFERISTVPADDARTNPLGQYVLFAESDGRILGEAHPAAQAAPAPARRALPEVAFDERPAPAALARGPEQRDPEVLRRHVEERIIDSVTRALRVDRREFDPSAPYVDFGIDSMMAVEVIGGINESLGINLRTTDLFNYSTIRDLQDHILKNLGDQIALPTSGVTPGVEPRSGEASAAARPSETPAVALLPAPPEARAAKAEVPVPAPAFVTSGGPARGAVPESIAVIGVSGRYAGARNAEQLWENLAAGRNFIRPMPAQRRAPGGDEAPFWGGYISDVDAFDAPFFHISGREAELMDPQQRLFLQEAWAALEDAGYSDAQLEQRKCGVFVGCFPGDYKYKLKEAELKPEPHLLMGNSEAILASRISYFLNLKGPSVTIDTACSSSLVALHLACESIRSGTCEMALAGGVTLMTTAEFHILASTARMLSPDGQCYTFDARANGFVPGEGVGVVVLKPLEAALRDGDYIHGVIRGSGLNQDGKTNGITAPSATSQAALEVEVYRRHGIHPEAIGYVEAHGTGTRLGDPIEISALTDAFRQFTSRKRFCAVGSVKTNVGHSLPASGMAGLLKVLLCLRHQKLVPSLNFQRANGHIDFEGSPFYVNTELMDWEIPEGGRRVAAISAFGFSGTNAHVVVEEAPAPAASVGRRRAQHLVAVSAKTEEALRRRLEALAEWLGTSGRNARLEDVGFTSNVGRSHFARRCAFVAGSVEELRARIRAVLEGDRPAGYVARGPGPAPGARGTESSLDGEGLEPAELRRRLLALGERYCAGEQIDWARFHTGYAGRRLPMPTYPFAIERYWVPGTPAPAAREPAARREAAAARSPVEREPARREEIAASASLLPQVVAAVRPHLRGAESLAAYVDAFGELERFGHVLLLHAFQRMGVMKEGGARYRRDELKRQLGVVAEYARLFECLIDMLGRAGFLALEGEGEELVVRERVEAAEVRRTLERLEAERDALLERCPEVAPHLHLLWACVSAYPSVLTGQLNPMAVMFPNGSTQLVEGIYKGNAVVDHYNQLVARLVAAYVERRVEAEPSARVRVLEVGAGTGGTSGFVLTALQPYASNVEYRYTDVSARFIRHGEETFGPSAPFARFQTLDIEQPPEPQGFESGREDLVFATNVLHATRDMRVTLRHVQRLLKRDGVLIVNEIMKCQDYATLTFGLTRGWWLYDDEAVRLPGSPLLDVSSWRGLLEVGGWREIQAVELEGSEGAVSRVLVASHAGRPGAAAAEVAGAQRQAAPPGDGEPGRGPPLENRLRAEDRLRAAAADFVRKTLAEVLKVDRARIDDDASFEVYGVDSLVVVELAVPLGAAFGELPPTLLFEHRSINALVDYLMKERAEAVIRLAGEAAPAAPASAPASAPAPRGEPGRASSEAAELLLRELAKLPDGRGLEIREVQTRSGARVELLTCGAGRPLLLLPPLNTLAVVWLSQMLEFSREHRVIVAHYPGHGRSDFRPELFDFERATGEILEALDKIGAGGPADVVGWSLGGCLAQVMAVKHPDRLRTLTLVSTAAVFSGGYEAKAPFIVEELQANLRRLPEPLQSERLLNVITATREPEVLMTYYQRLRGFDYREQLQRIQVPTWVVSGRDDKILSPEFGREIHRAIQSSQYRELEAVGHFIPLVAHVKFNELLARFIRSGAVEAEPGQDVTREA